MHNLYIFHTNLPQKDIRVTANSLKEASAVFAAKRYLPDFYSDRIPVTLASGVTVEYTIQVYLNTLITLKKHSNTERTSVEVSFSTSRPLLQTFMFEAMEQPVTLIQHDAYICIFRFDTIPQLQVKLPTAAVEEVIDQQWEETGLGWIRLPLNGYVVTE